MCKQFGMNLSLFCTFSGSMLTTDSICGSEDGRTYIWNTSHASGETKEKLPVEYFQASDMPVTVAIMAPVSSTYLSTFSYQGRLGVETFSRLMTYSWFTPSNVRMK